MHQQMHYRYPIISTNKWRMQWSKYIIDRTAYENVTAIWIEMFRKRFSSTDAAWTRCLCCKTLASYLAVLWNRPYQPACYFVPYSGTASIIDRSFPHYPPTQCIMSDDDQREKREKQFQISSIDLKFSSNSGTTFLFVDIFHPHKTVI
jgi:hypothetical protein